jgi:hypothetical protein
MGAVREFDDEGLHLELCLRSYVPATVAGLARLYLPKALVLEEETVQEWVGPFDCQPGVCSSEHNTVLRHASSGVLQIVGAPCRSSIITRTSAPTRPPEWRLPEWSQTWQTIVTDGTTIWGLYGVAGRTLFRAELIKSGDLWTSCSDPLLTVNARPATGESRPDLLLYDDAAKEIVLGTLNLLGGATIEVDWRCSTTFTHKRHKTFPAMHASKFNQMAACNGWILVAQRQPTLSLETCLLAASPESMQLELIVSVGNCLEAGHLIPMDDETVLWIVLCASGRYESVRSTGVKHIQVVSGITSEELERLGSELLPGPITAVFALTVTRLHIESPTKICVAGQTRFQLRIPQAPNSRFEPYLWRAAVPIICPQSSRVVGIAAEITVERGRHMLVPFL